MAKRKRNKAAPKRKPKPKRSSKAQPAPSNHPLPRGRAPNDERAWLD